MTDLSRFDGICKHQALLDQPCEECEREENPPTDQQPMTDKPITREQFERRCNDESDPHEFAEWCWSVIEGAQQRVAELEQMAWGMYEVINDLPHKWSCAFNHTGACECGRNPTLANYERMRERVRKLTQETPDG